MKIATSLCKLNPVLNGEGILRVGGRLENADVSYDAKHEIILPYRHHITNLIIQKYHQEAGHLGQEYVLSSLGQLYGLSKGDQWCVEFSVKVFCAESLVQPVENS